jgi:lipopolysaccharide export system permease protein
MLIRRYLFKEITTTFSAVILVIMLIAVSNKFVRLIGKAAMGDIAPDILLQVFLFQIPELLAFLLPIALFLAILLCFSRFFADNEIPVMFACGISWQRLLGVSLSVGTIVMLLAGLLTCYGTPRFAQYREELLHKEGPLLLIQTITPGRFHAFQHDRFVFYMADLSADRSQLKHIFIAEQPKKTSDKEGSVVTAQSGEIVREPNTENTYIKLKEGRRYSGKPGDNDYSMIEFQEYQRLIEQTVTPEGLVFQRATPTQQLLQHPTPANNAELQWRLSIPLSALLLAFLAVPLSRVSPRAGRFGKLFIAVVICIVYFNLLTISKRWISSGILSPWIGVWWVHILLFLLAACWLVKASGRGDQWRSAAKQYLSKKT